MKPRSSTVDPGGLGLDGAAVGHAPDGDEHAVEHPRAGAGDLHLEPVLLGLDALRPAGQEHVLVAAADPLGQDADEVGVAAREQVVEHLHDGHLGAERVVDARHLQTDDPAADHQQPPRDRRRRQRSGGVDDPLVLGQARDRRRLGPGGDDEVVEGDLAVADGQRVGAGELARRRGSTSTLRRLASPTSPPVSLSTTDCFHSSSLGRSTLGLPNETPCVAISSVSAITRAACSSALEGMQPTLRQTPPSALVALDQRGLQPQVGRAERGRVAAGAGAEHHDLEVPVAVSGGRGRGGGSASRTTSLAGGRGVGCLRGAVCPRLAAGAVGRGGRARRVGRGGAVERQEQRPLGHPLADGHRQLRRPRPRTGRARPSWPCRTRA